MSSEKLTFVFEVCKDCKGHQWNTRHDEAKYASYFADMSAKISELIPGSVCIMNQVPKPWFEKDVYCQLIPNEDERNPNYDMLPRIGAFEISTVHQGVDVLFYSKMMSNMWPHVTACANRIKAFCDEMGKTQPALLKEKF